MAKKQRKSASKTRPRRKEIQKQKGISLSMNEIEERLTANILKATLALHLLKNSKKPTSRLVDELFDIEIEVGRFISAALQGRLGNLPSNLKGTLATTLSFMPLGPSRIENKISKNKRSNKKPIAVFDHRPTKR